MYWDTVSLKTIYVETPLTEEVKRVYVIYTVKEFFLPVRKSYIMAPCKTLHYGIQTAFQHMKAHQQISNQQYYNRSCQNNAKAHTDRSLKDTRAIVLWNRTISVQPCKCISVWTPKN